MPDEFILDYITIPYPIYMDSRLEGSDRVIYGVIYFYSHMKNRKCFASNTRFGEIAGVQERTVRSALTRLEDCGYIRRTYKDAGRRHRVEIEALVSFKAMVDGSLKPTRRHQNVPLDGSLEPHKKNSKKNNKNAAAKPAAPAPSKIQKEYSLTAEIEKLEENPRRDMNIIAHYLEERRPDLQTYEQFEVALKRHLRPAKLLVPFTDDQILRASKRARKEYPEWTLETVQKLLTK